MTVSMFFQGLINGLNQGAIYALIALGYTMVYGIIRMINFAHGDFIMIGAYTLFYTIPAMVAWGMPAWLAIVFAIAICSVVGVVVEIFAYRPVRKAGPMTALITALAMSIFSGKSGDGAVRRQAAQYRRDLQYAGDQNSPREHSAQCGADNPHRPCDDAGPAIFRQEDADGEGHARRAAG
jgi:branched-subunit amino acid ABC-type transport system permease component